MTASSAGTRARGPRRRSPSPQACNPKYSDYGRTGSICASEGVNDTLTQYRWLTSVPAGPDGVAGPLREVDFDTFFTSSKTITLDAVYFRPGSRVQCAARAVTAAGDQGLELLSPVVTVARADGEARPLAGGSAGRWCLRAAPALSRSTSPRRGPRAGRRAPYTAGKPLSWAGALAGVSVPPCPRGEDAAPSAQGAEMQKQAWRAPPCAARGGVLRDAGSQP